MKKLLLLPIILLAGCSTVLTDRQIEAMNKPTLTLNCITGCSASYTDPRDRPKMPTNGWDVATSAINATAGVVSSTAPWAAIGITAAKGITNAGDRSDNRVDDNSDNRVDDNSDDSDNRTWDTTHEPTVVTQPEPIIMNQPEPTVITQPDPIILTQPEPIIIQPEPASE